MEIGVAFQGDGTATFRHLCAGCERIERRMNQPGLFKTATPGESRKEENSKER